MKRTGVISGQKGTLAEWRDAIGNPSFNQVQQTKIAFTFYGGVLRPDSVLRAKGTVMLFAPDSSEVYRHFRTHLASDSGCCVNFGRKF